ncbi:peptidase domain-containing ABC transporter [Sphingobium yanoikuyae]|uniref:peptidase domain-containing ABC transporter n=1 Tax=Sphingobium yanoikuyae TaxID=13690 RepID=UPI0028DBB80B|nr:peptidase domain-containing ABC transporter [Sphingobium yanoikuyae]
MFGERKVRLVIQTEIAECGLACLAMIAQYHGLEVDLGGLRRRFTPPTRGSSLTALVACAEQLGFIARALRIELEDLGALALPAILHWNLNHFVVLERINGRKGYIHDPSGVSRWLDIDDISRRFTGVALELSPSINFEPGQYHHRLRLSQLSTKINGFWGTASKIVTLSILIQCLTLALPYYSQVAIDRAVTEGSIETLNALTVGFLMIAIVYSLLYWLRSQVLLSSGATLGYSLSTNLARRMLRLPVSWFNNRHVGDVLARFQSIKPIRDALTQDVFVGFIDGILAVTTFFFMAYYSYKIAVVPLTGAIILLLFRLIIFQRHRSAQETAIVYSGREQSNLIEIIRGIKSIHLSSKYKNKEIRWRSRLVDSINAEVQEKKFTNIEGFAKVSIERCENIIFIWISLYVVILGDITIGSAFALYAYKAQFSLSSASLIDNLWKFKMLGLHMDRIGDIALSPEDQRYSQPIRPHRKLIGKIELSNVHYRYSQFDPPVLRGASIVFQPGESVAITGPSGEGKSTLAQILLGLIEPDSGIMLVDGMPLDVFGYENYYQSVAAVLQDDTLFAGSIIENISLFDDGVDIEEVRAAALLADIDKDIAAMPMGYDTLVGDMGAALSGGQKQRILLARALFQKPQFLVLDEGTSHLDAESEKRVNLSISRLGITRFIIAHREETIRSADRVLFMKNGEILDG